MSDEKLLVSRDLLESALACVASNNTSNWSSELKAALVTVLAQPLDGALTNEAKLSAPAKVGAVIFRVGVSERTVIECAQRVYEASQQPNVEAARLERLASTISQAVTNEGAEPVAWMNVATGHVTASPVVVMDWDDEKEQVVSLYRCPPAPALVVMSFDFEHPFSKQRLTVKLAKQDVYDGMEDYFYEKLGEQICQCESVGETNVVDCNCDEYVHDFELVADNACLDRIKELNL